MLYYCAPMEGFTDAVFRRIHARYFGAEGAADRYFSPFVSPTADNRLDPRKLRDLLPAANEGIPLIPQALGKEAAPLLWLASRLADLGYRQMDLNLGCPSGTVVAKGKGSGLLRDAAALDRLLDGIFGAAPPLEISIKTRLGIASPDEFSPLFDILNRYPLAELTIHPRVQQQHYRGHVHLAQFEAALAAARCPVCYNGDLITADACADFTASHPTVHAIMLGRGLLADPALLRRLRGGAPAGREELDGYLTALYEGYCAVFGSKNNAVRRMKGHWNYLLGLFEVDAKLEKRLRRLTLPADYERLAHEITATSPLRQHAVNVWQLT